LAGGLTVPCDSLPRAMAPSGMAEGEGFEPPEPFGSPVFKTGALNHSATLPGLRLQVKRYVIGAAASSGVAGFAGILASVLDP
jgi:hypothetical protein